MSIAAINPIKYLLPPDLPSWDKGGGGERTRLWVSQKLWSPAPESLGLKLICLGASLD